MASSTKSTVKTPRTTKASAPSKSDDNTAINKNDPSTYNGEKYRDIAKKLLKNDDVIELYRQMLLCRRFEERCGQQYQMRKIQGFCHLYIGQEAVAVGTIAALEQKDLIFQTYRDHAHALLKGISAREVMAELFGKATGCSKGKGGSMHLFRAETGMMGGNGIVGGHVPLATGAAFASRYNDKKQVSVCYMGEAAVNQGVFHESLNMASLWKLPAVYITENNLYGMGTAVERASAEDQLFKRTEGAYRIPGIRCDGMDVLEMYGVMHEAAERARSGNGPTFLEAITYRYRGHSMSDPATTYRNKDEVSVWQRRDPMSRLQADYPKLLTEALTEEIDTKVKEEVQDCIKFAEESPFPDASELYTDIYLDYPGYPGPGQ
ncbi:MAG: pyruvate dehydrogenase (acetyl-transferring) E1 component subunit alpha [Sumerlaeia bacterium]